MFTTFQDITTSKILQLTSQCYRKSSSVYYFRVVCTRYLVPAITQNRINIQVGFMLNWKVFIFVYYGNIVPDYPGQCYDKETNEPVAVGKESNNLMGCKSQICKTDFRFAVTT